MRAGRTCCSRAGNWRIFCYWIFRCRGWTEWRWRASCARGATRRRSSLVTGFADYMQAGYDVEAVHYLLKPVKPEKLLEVLSRARERLESGARMAALRIEGEWVRLRVQDVLYAESRGHYAHIFLRDGRELRAKMRWAIWPGALGADFFLLPTLVFGEHALRGARDGGSPGSGWRPGNPAGAGIARGGGARVRRLQLSK